MVDDLSRRARMSHRTISRIARSGACGEPNQLRAGPSRRASERRGDLPTAFVQRVRDLRSAPSNRCRYSDCSHSGSNRRSSGTS